MSLSKDEFLSRLGKSQILKEMSTEVLLFPLIIGRNLLFINLMNKNSKIYLAGHRGLVGAALYRRLRENGYTHIITRTSRELDLRRQEDVETFFRKEKPEYVFLSAARVGGILANIRRPADFIYDNLSIQNNVIHSACENPVKKLLFISSSCSYPRLCPQPMEEDFILTGKPEPTNEYYAIAKICGMKLIEAYFKQYHSPFFSIIFPNIYGIGDNFDPASSHVISSLIRRMHEARIKNLPDIEIWGSGKPRREFLYVDDAADACIYFMNVLEGGRMLNVGTGQDISISELAALIRDIVGYKGRLVFNPDMPDGMPQKLLDVHRMAEFGWQARVSLSEGIQKTFQWFVENYDSILEREHAEG